MALEEHEIKQLEQRFEDLEEKLRTTFAEVQRRFDEFRAQPTGTEDRLQELEDLILLMQLEVTKIKDRTGTVTEFLTPQTPNMAERMNRLEEAMSLKAAEEEKEGEPLMEQEAESEEAETSVAEPETTEEEGEEHAEAKAAHRTGKSLLEEVRSILSS